MKSLRLAATLWWALLIFALPATAGEFRLSGIGQGLRQMGRAGPRHRATVTYAFATHETVNEDARNCRHMTAFSDLSSSAHLPLPVLRAEAREAFGNWGEGVGPALSAKPTPGYSRYPDRHSSQPLRTCLYQCRTLQAIGGGNGCSGDDGLGELRRQRRQTRHHRSANRSSASIPRKPGRSVSTATTRLTMSAMRSPTRSATPSDSIIPGASGALMGFRYTEKVRGLQSGDIEAVRTLYGP